MDIQYSNKKVEKIFSDWEEMKKQISYDWVKKIKRYLDAIKASDTFQVFLSTGLDHPESLTGFDKPTWTLRISPNARLIFEIDDKDPKKSKNIIVKGVFDDHGGKYNWYIS